MLFRSQVRRGRPTAFSPCAPGDRERFRRIKGGKLLGQPVQVAAGQRMGALTRRAEGGGSGRVENKIASVVVAQGLQQLACRLRFYRENGSQLVVIKLDSFLDGISSDIAQEKKKSSKFLGVFAQPKTSLDQHQTKLAIGHLNTIWLVVLV